MKTLYIIVLLIMFLGGMVVGKDSVRFYTVDWKEGSTDLISASYPCGRVVKVIDTSIKGKNQTISLYCK